MNPFVLIIETRKIFFSLTKNFKTFFKRILESFKELRDHLKCMVEELDQESKILDQEISNNIDKDAMNQLILDYFGRKSIDLAVLFCEEAGIDLKSMQVYKEWKCLKEFIKERNLEEILNLFEKNVEDSSSMQLDIHSVIFKRKLRQDSKEAIDYAKVYMSKFESIFPNQFAKEMCAILKDKKTLLDEENEFWNTFEERGNDYFCEKKNIPKNPPLLTW
jgi:hypothetical protein